MKNESKRMLSERLASGQPLLGLLQLHPSPLFARLAGECAYDFIFLDDEHGTLSESDFADSLKLLAASNVLAFVRLAGQDPEDLRRYLAMGADAILVPHVSTAEEASGLARAMEPYKEAGLIPIIESALGVANAAEILAVEGVAGAIVGPNDLSADLGYQGDYAHPDYAQALASIERAAAAAGKILGTIPHGDYSLEALHARGHRLFILGTDRGLLHQAMSEQLSHARSRLTF
jgi:4-hydroxy-2-oxoheptanedioate aldolase